MVALIAAADPDGPESVTPTAVLETRFDTPGFRPVRAKSVRRVARASGARNRRPAPRCSSVRRVEGGERRFFYTSIAGTPDPSRGREPRHRLVRSARPTGALHLQRRHESRGLRSAARQFPPANGGLVRRARAAAGGDARAAVALAAQAGAAPGTRDQGGRSGHTRTPRRRLAARARRRHQQPQRAARWRTHAHPALPRHARQSRAQPEDTARGHAPVAAVPAP